MTQDRYEDAQGLLDEVRESFESELEEDMQRIDIQDSVLSNALKEQIELQIKYEDFWKTADFLVNELGTECDRMFAIAFKELMSDSYKKLTPTEAKSYAQSDADYVDYKRLYNDAKYLKGRIETIVDALRTRRFLLKNITDMLSQGNESYII